MFEHLPELLRRLRLAAGWTQQECAARAGLSVGQLSRIEAGYQAPRLDTLSRLLKALGLTLTDFARRYEALEQELTDDPSE